LFHIHRTQIIFFVNKKKLKSVNNYKKCALIAVVNILLLHELRAVGEVGSVYVVYFALAFGSILYFFVVYNTNV
jgi:hypothetical protein